VGAEEAVALLELMADTAGNPTNAGDAAVEVLVSALSLLCTVPELAMVLVRHNVANVLKVLVTPKQYIINIF
jgi:hypothetical protein